MNVITKLMYSIHRILGTLLSILFFVWFLSAFVMMYHRFPRVSEKEKLQKLELLTQTTDSLPDIAEVTGQLQGEKIRSLSLNRSLGQTLFEVRTHKGELKLPATSSDTIFPIDKTLILRKASLWNKEAIARIDTLQALDTWIPFEKLKKELLQLLNELEEIATRGTFKTGREVCIYISNINFEATYSYIASSAYHISLVRVFAINSFATRDEQVFNSVKEWIHSLKKFSTLISQSGEMQRIQFFNRQREIINTL